MRYALIGCGMICANHIRAARSAISWRKTEKRRSR